MSKEKFTQIIDQISNNSIKIVDLEEKKLEESELINLALNLKNNTSVTSLNLKHQDLDQIEKVVELASALKNNTSITSLNLSFTQLEIGGATSLAFALQYNTSLTSLDLSFNNLNNGIIPLVKAIKNNTSLSHLNFSHNFMKSEGASELAKNLRNYTSLTSLDLNSNLLDNPATYFLSQYLRENNSLMSLDIGRNCINNNGINELADALKENFTLTDIDVSNHSDQICPNCEPLDNNILKLIRKEKDLNKTYLKNVKSFINKFYNQQINNGILIDANDRCATKLYYKINKPGLILQLKSKDQEKFKDLNLKGLNKWVESFIREQCLEIMKICKKLNSDSMLSILPIENRLNIFSFLEIEDIIGDLNDID